MPIIPGSITPIGDTAARDEAFRNPASPPGPATARAADVSSAREPAEYRRRTGARRRRGHRIGADTDTPAPHWRSGWCGRRRQGNRIIGGSGRPRYFTRVDRGIPGTAHSAPPLPIPKFVPTLGSLSSYARRTVEAGSAPGGSRSQPAEVHVDLHEGLVPLGHELQLSRITTPRDYSQSPSERLKAISRRRMSQVCHRDARQAREGIHR